MTQPDKVCDLWIFETHNGAVKNANDCTCRIQTGETHVVDGVGPMREEDEQEKQFVPMGVDETGHSSSLQMNGVHDVERRRKDCLVDVEVRKHHPLVPLKEVLKDVIEERYSGYNILNGMVSSFISNGVSLSSFVRRIVRSRISLGDGRFIVK